jgi:perosamine synthetase
MKMIPHSRPSISEKDMAVVNMVLRFGHISTGKEVAALEEAFSRKFSFGSSAAVSSGTAALHLALLALGVGPGDEVIIPTHVCTALVNAVRYTGAKEVLVDVCEDGNIDPRCVLRAMTRRTKAVIAAHMWGSPADIRTLVKCGVPVIEDCAQSVGASVKGKAVGSFGAVSIFSFYATKMITSGEGGLIGSKDKRFINKVRDLADYDHKKTYEMRFNYKMTDVQAALALSQLGHLEGFISARRRIAARYACHVPSILPVTQGAEPVFYRYVVRTDKNVARVISSAKAKGVCIEKPLFRPLHQYLAKKGFPVSEMLMRQCVSLPIYPFLTASEEKRVIDVAKDLI